jgi:hypothetical protein
MSTVTRAFSSNSADWGAFVQATALAWGDADHDRELVADGLKL